MFKGEIDIINEELNFHPKVVKFQIYPVMF